MPAKGAPKKNELQKLDLASRAADLRLKGKSYRAIGKALKVSHTEVERIIKGVKKEWLKELNEDLAAIRAESLAHINLLIRECWELYDRSARQVTKTAHKTVEKALKVHSSELPDELAYHAGEEPGFVYLPGKEVTDQTNKEKPIGSIDILREIKSLVLERLRILGAYNPPEEDQGKGGTHGVVLMRQVYVNGLGNFPEEALKDPEVWRALSKWIPNQQAHTFDHGGASDDSGSTGE